MYIYFDAVTELRITDALHKKVNNGKDQNLALYNYHRTRAFCENALNHSYNNLLLLIDVVFRRNTTVLVPNNLNLKH